MTVADRLLVPFEGSGCGVGELSWGQREMWGMIRRLGSSLALGGVSPLPAGMSLEAAAAVLSVIMSRHQSLRTRLRFDTDGRARQVIAASGTATLEIVDPGDADPAVAAQAVWDRFHAVEFDYVNEWPVRMAVIRQGAVLTHVVATYCHLALDGGGLAALVADLADLGDPAHLGDPADPGGPADPADPGDPGDPGDSGDSGDPGDSGGPADPGDPEAGTGRSTSPVRGLPPLEQARWEASPAGQRRSAASLRHWERLLRGIPARRFPSPASHGGRRFQEAEYRSPAMYLAARVVAARAGVDTSPVLLAAVAVALAQVTGINPSVAQVMVSNRFRPGIAASVSAVSLPGLCVVDVAGSTFDEVVARAWQSSLSAYKNAYYDPSARDQLVARLGRERGEDLDIFCFVNDRRDPSRREVSGSVPSLDEVSAALPAGRLDWREVPVDPVSERFSLRVNDVPDTIEMQVAADTHHVSPAVMAAFLRATEAVTVRAALNPAARTGV